MFWRASLNPRPRTSRGEASPRERGLIRRVPAHEQYEIPPGRRRD